MAQRSQTIVLIFLAWLLVGCSRGAKMCAVCQRAECKAMAFRVTLENGKVIETCCPRCGLHYVAVNKQRAREFDATDFATGHWMDATKAIYVEGSDWSPCSNLETRREGEGGCCLMKTYDRCLPSLVAFANRGEATVFREKHSGQLIAWQEIAAKSTVR